MSYEPPSSTLILPLKSASWTILIPQVGPFEICKLDRFYSAGWTYVEIRMVELWYLRSALSDALTPFPESRIRKRVRVRLTRTRSLGAVCVYHTIRGRAPCTPASGAKPLMDGR